MRSLHIVEMCLSLALAAAAIPANADNSIVTVQPDANAQAELGQILGNALLVKQIARLAVIVKCNHYHLIEVTYRNGSIKVLDDPRAPGGRNEPMDRDRLETLAATLPGFTWGELPCEE